MNYSTKHIESKKPEALDPETIEAIHERVKRTMLKQTADALNAAWQKRKDEEEA